MIHIVSMWFSGVHPQTEATNSNSVWLCI